MKIEEGQIYTFDNEKTYNIINHIEDDYDIWYQIWSKDESYLYSKIHPNEITFIDIDFISKYEFEELFKSGFAINGHHVAASIHSNTLLLYIENGFVVFVLM